MSGCKPEVVPLDHGTVYCVEWTHRELHSPRLPRTGPACGAGDFLLDDEPISLASGSRGTRTHKRRLAATCFQDRLLIRPDDFRSSFLLPPCARHTPVCRAQLLAPGVGIEPTTSWFRARYRIPAATTPEFGSLTALHYRLRPCFLAFARRAQLL